MPCSIALLAISISAREQVRPARACSAFIFPARCAIASVMGKVSRLERRASVRRSSSGRIPAYTSATFMAEVARSLPSPTMAASCCRTSPRFRSASISTAVSSRTLTRARRPRPGVLAPSFPCPQPVRGVPHLAKPVPRSQENQQLAPLQLRSGRFHQKRTSPSSSDQRIDLTKQGLRQYNIGSLYSHT